MRTEREVLMLVENKIIAAQCFPRETAFRAQLDDALTLIRNYLSGDAFCEECDGTGWKVTDYVICLTCNNTGRVTKGDKK